MCFYVIWFLFFESLIRVYTITIYKISFVTLRAFTRDPTGKVGQSYMVVCAYNVSTKIFEKVYILKKTLCKLD